MARATFEDLWKQIRAEAKAEGPEAVEELRRLQHRYRLGGELSIARNRRHLTQQQLAERTGIDQADISRIERGGINASEDTLARLGRELGVRLAFVPDREAVPA